MRRVIIIISLLLLLIQPVHGLEISAPKAPESIENIMPTEVNSFGEDLLLIIKNILPTITPAFVEAARICLALIGVVLLVSLTDFFSQKGTIVTNLVCVLSVGVILVRPVNAMIELGVKTVTEITEYGKLLLPVMTSALAAQGGITTSGALYAGTALFSSILSSFITSIAIPLVYVFICLALTNCAFEDKTIQSFRDFSKWSVTWILKIILYVFIGYMGITGVISGTADASAIKATKIAISGAVPVVGSILSDASESILISASLMKSAAGVYGILTVLTIFLGPFLRIGIQYILLKITTAVCYGFGSKKAVEAVQNFTVSMGLVLAMTGTVCLLQLISTVCFLKGVN